MATYVLDSSNTARLPQGPLAVTLTASDVAAPPRLTTRTASGRPVQTVPNGPTMIILPSINELTTIGALPPAGSDRFGPNTVLHLSIAPESALSRGGDTASLAPRDVSGLAFVDLATVAPESDGQLLVTTLLDVEDVALPPVAHAARIATRGVLGGDHVRAGRELAVRCVVDVSTSMSAAYDQGAVAACADIVAGVTAVISGSSWVEWVAALPGGPGFARAELGVLGTTVGARPAAGLGMAPDLTPGITASVGGPTLTVVITDGPVTATGTPDNHVVALTVSGGSPTPGDVPAAVCPLAGDDVQKRLAADPTAVTTIIADLLGPLREDGLL